VGPDTSWQIFCSDNDDTHSCGTSEQPHGPLDGMKAADKSDDYKLKTSCSKEGSGYVITIEDPGRDENISKKLGARPRGVLAISRANPAKNQCYVTVTEYPLSGGERVLQDTCAGTTAANGEAGTCTFEGEAGSNDYDFEGTLKCDGLRYKGQGAAAWVLRGALHDDSPVTLQIANCN
jgi:hypothetical protein